MVNTKCLPLVKSSFSERNTATTITNIVFNHFFFYVISSEVCSHSQTRYNTIHRPCTNPILHYLQSIRCVYVFQDRVRALSDIGAEELTLSVCGAPLDDEVLVSELSCSELDLTVPLLGGKVHGSLARAGESN